MILALDQLPPEHPLRNRPLFEIGASYQWCNTKEPHQWHRVTKNSTTANTTYNELGERWVGYRWRAAAVE